MPKIPGAQAVHHLGITVPDLDEAVEFFIEAIGAEIVYRIGPISDPGGRWMPQKLNVHASATVHIAMLRLGPVTNLEVFQYSVPGQNDTIPRVSDMGGYHIAIHVKDIDLATEYLRSRSDITILGRPGMIDKGPLANDEWVYFTTPWGMHMELIKMPQDLPVAEESTARMFMPMGDWHNGKS